MSVLDDLISILESLSLPEVATKDTPVPAWPVRRQGSLGEDEAYPDSFFTFWCIETPGAAFYDNAPTVHIWRYTVYFYSTDPSLVNSVPITAAEALRAAGWIVDGKGYDVPSDEITHTGRAFEAVFVEREAAETQEETT